MNQSPTDLDSCAPTGARIFIAEFPVVPLPAPPPANLLRHLVAPRARRGAGAQIGRRPIPVLRRSRDADASWRIPVVTLPLHHRLTYSAPPTLQRQLVGLGLHAFLRAVQRSLPNDFVRVSGKGQDKWL